MATKIRLRRTGNRNLALYRIVVADSRSPRDGRFIENLGHYDPRKDGADKITVNLEKVSEWIDKGAEVSETVRTLLKTKDFKFPVKKRKKNKKSVTTEKVQAPVQETVEKKVVADEAPVEETVAKDTAAAE